MTANRKRLTEDNVLGVPTRRTPYRVWDSGSHAARGLFVLVQPSGTRAYHVSFRFDGATKEHTMALGRVGEIALEDARAKALTARKAAARGDDPRKRDGADSFKGCVQTWIANECQGRKGLLTADRTQSYVLAICKRWHDRAIGTLRYGEIDDLLSEYRKAHPYGANRIHTHLKQMFRWAVRTKRISASPMAEMPPPWLGAKPRQRDWFAGENADNMIVRLWNGATQLGGDRERFIKLVMITGKRRGAIETMHWEHISADWYWQPTCGNKWKRCHAIPLPKLAQRVLGKHGGTGRVLEPFNPDNLRKQVARLIGVDDFFFHGCRHMAETKMGELKVLPHIRDMILDHASKRGTGKDYDHGDYREEVGAALELWAGYVERLVAPAENARVLR